MRLTLSAILTLCVPAVAQWLNYPTAGIPRLADGKPNLSAPAPRTPDDKPDLSGIWEPIGPVGSTFTDASARDPQFQNVGRELKDGLPLLPWAADLLKARMAANSKDAPDTNCQPLGPVQMHLHPFPRRIMQTPALMVILFERDTQYRQIFLDGRSLPVDPQPSFNGYSTGKWDGDTLVVETIGIRDGTWLDVRGTPLTDAAKVTERFGRPSFGQLEIEITVDDPRAYSKPWTIRVTQAYAADTDTLEFVCLENEKDRAHLTER
jgi:hypothetical protein